MKTKMKLTGVALGSLMMMLGFAPTAGAEPVDNPVTEDTNADDEGGFDDWGLLGLLGLLGLGGLAGRKRTDDVVAGTRPSGTGSTSR